MSITINMPTAPFGIWSIVYNVVLFIVACGLLFVVKRYPDYKIGLVVLIVGIFLVNVNSMLRFYWYEQNLKAMQNAQQANIVPNHCPDYWVKVDNGNTKQCVNQFVKPSEDNNPNNAITYTFGGSNAAQKYNLTDMTALTNQQKCLANPSMAPWANVVPWVDMKNKCSDANV